MDKRRNWTRGWPRALFTLAALAGLLLNTSCSLVNKFFATRTPTPTATFTPTLTPTQTATFTPIADPHPRTPPANLQPERTPPIAPASWTLQTLRLHCDLTESAPGYKLAAI